MVGVPLRDRNPVDPILLQLQKCGVELAKATLVERADEKYVTLKGHRQLGRQESACIAKVLVPADVGLRADNLSTDEFYTDAWEAVHRSSLAKRARDWLKQHRPNVKLVKYQPGQTLQDYVMSIEMACGAQSRTARSKSSIGYAIFGSLRRTPAILRRTVLRVR